jgi:ATP-dependent RNA helicase DeaD
MRIQRAKIPTVDEVHEVRASLFLDKLRATLTSGEYKKQDHLVERLLEEGFNSTDIASALIHHLQGGDATPAKPASAEEPSFERPERPPYRESRDSRGGRYEDRPARNAPYREDDRRERAPYRDAREERPRRFEDRPPRAEVKFADPKQSKTTPWKTTAAPVKKIIPPPVETRRSRGDETQIEKKSETPHVVTYKPEQKAEAVKTFSDAEILAAVKTPEAKPESKLFLKPKSAPVAAPKPKVSRATPADQTRLWISVGETQGVVPIDFVNTVAGITGLPGKVVGTVDVRERHSFVDVASEHANGIIAKLNRAEIKGHKVKVKVA